MKQLYFPDEVFRGSEIILSFSFKAVLTRGQSAHFSIVLNAELAT